MLKLTKGAEKALEKAMKEHEQVIIRLATGLAERNNKKEVGSEEVNQAVNTWEALKLVAQVESILTGGKEAKMTSALLNYLESKT